jgi:pimeloyl-ACP methyl ester carboxylesterase
VVFSHGWPVNADAWESQMVYLASNGDRGIAHDRRGHGRSSQPWNGNEMDTYADDQIVPIGASAHASSALINNAILKVYPGGPHGLAYTHRDQLNADLLAFLRA